MKSFAIVCARVILGLIFGMAGYYKCFAMTPVGHARHYFIEPYATTWIPTWLLWTTGVTIPIVELIAGWLLVVGWRVRESLVALGLVLIIVTYGHLLKEPLFSFSGHVIPRLALLVFVAMLPADEDWLSLDWWLRHRRRSASRQSMHEEQRR
jgi:thiosulfate dehydrogenase (quinone) large subunit